MTEILFDSFGFSSEINQAISKMGFTSPSPIQAAAIPFLLEGKDIIGQAQTGTGKTAAFALPIIEKIDIANRQVQSVVICPTRELAIQVADEFRKLAKFKPNLSIVCVYGGQPIDIQQRALRNQPQILIGTPGRMLDFLWRGTFHLNSVKTVVLDEADEMLNMGFRDDIEKIFGFIPTPRQTVFFSATMPKAILELTAQYQVNPEMVRVVPKQAETSQIAQSYLEIRQQAKPKALTQLIDQYNLNLALIFCNTKHQVDSLVTHLQQAGYAAEGLHGGKAQNQRERILGRFRKGTTQFLVATDVAARGIDIRNIQAVVNFDLPEDEENYTHRIGRTGRAGQSGQAFSLVAGHQLRLLKLLQKAHRNAIVRETLPGFEFTPQNNMAPGKPRPNSNFQKPRRPQPKVMPPLQKAL